MIGPVRHRRFSALTVLVCASMMLTGCLKKSSSQTAPVVSSEVASPAVDSGTAPVAPATSAPGPSVAAPVSPSATSSVDVSAPLTAIVLQPADLPDWTSAPSTPDPNSAAENAALAKCVGQPDTSPDQVAEVDSPDYSSGNASISSSASSFKKPSDLTADIAILKSAKVSTCYDVLVRSEAPASLPPGTTLNSVTIVITPGSTDGPRNVVATGAGKINISQSGQRADVFLNVAFITGPLIEAEVDFENVGEPVPAAIRAAVIAKVAARAAAANPGIAA
jgi:hypothetical protein